MKKLFCLTILPLLLFISPAAGQKINVLRREIQKIVSTKNAVVGVSIADSNGKEILSINGDRRFPMQSVFKFHIALAVLTEIDKGKLSLDQKITVEKKELLPNLYSPLREKYPDGATLSIAELIKFAVSQSDNVACDVLLRLIGGPPPVEFFFVRNGFRNVSIKINEETMQNNWDLQFQNWTTPKAANEILSAFYDNEKKLLSANSYDFIWKTMKETETGKNRIKSPLPAKTVVAHKTGTSGVNKEGLTAALNDIGIVFLPNGQRYAISVFVTNSKEDTAANEKIIADISKATWHYFTSRKK